jgi:tripartite-type tricarboxylate transporter receptor subunit TctC
MSIAMIAFAATGAWAEWKPTKNVELVAPATPGGGYDTLARAVHRVISEQKLLSVPINVVNKAGGGSSIGWGYVSQHAGDGHYVAVASSTLLTNDVAGINSFKWTDLTPLGILSTEYLVFSVRNENALKSANQLMAALRANPKGTKFATAPGPGNANHIVMGMMAKAIGADVRQLPLVFYSSAGDSAAAALGGHIDVVISSIPPVLGHVSANRMRILAVSAPQRLSGSMASVPTWRELGVDAVFVNWRGIVGPKNLGHEQVRFWEGVLKTLAESDAWKTYSVKTFSEPQYIDSAGTAKFLAAQHVEVSATMTELGLKK